MLITAIDIVSLKSFLTFKPFNVSTTPIPFVVDLHGQPSTKPCSHSFKNQYTLCEGLVSDLVISFVSGIRRKRVLSRQTQISLAEIVEKIFPENA